MKWITREKERVYRTSCRRSYARNISPSHELLLETAGGGVAAMKGIPREKARVVRLACPWLIARFIDRAPEFLFVPAGEVLAVAAREGATPFDVPGAELRPPGTRRP